MYIYKAGSFFVLLIIKLTVAVILLHNPAHPNDAQLMSQDNSTQCTVTMCAVTKKLCTWCYKRSFHPHVT